MRRAILVLAVLALLTLPTIPLPGAAQDGVPTLQPQGLALLGGSRYPSEVRYPLPTPSQDVELVRIAFSVWVKNGSLMVGLKGSGDDWLVGPLELRNVSASYGGEERTVYAFGGVTLRLDIWRDWHVIAYIFHNELLVASFDLGPAPDLGDEGLNVSFIVAGGASAVRHLWSSTYYYPVLPDPVETANASVPDYALAVPGAVVEVFRYSGVLAIRDPGTLQLRCAFDVLDGLLDYTVRGYEADLEAYSFSQDRVTLILSIWNPLNMSHSEPDGFMAVVLNTSTCVVEHALILDGYTLNITPVRAFLSGTDAAVVVDEEVVYDPYGRRVGNISLFTVIDLTTGETAEYNTSGQLAYWGSDPQSGVTVALTADTLYIVWPNKTVTQAQVDSPIPAPWYTGAEMEVKGVGGTLLLRVGDDLLYYHDGVLTEIEPNGTLYSIAEDERHYYILTRTYTGSGTVWRITVITPGEGWEYIDIPVSQYIQAALGDGSTCAHLALKENTGSNNVEEALLCGAEYTVNWSKNMQVDSLEGADYGWVKAIGSPIGGVQVEILLNGDNTLNAKLRTGATLWDYVALYPLNGWAVLAARSGTYQDLLIVTLDPDMGSRVVGINSDSVSAVEWVHNNRVYTVSYRGSQIHYTVIDRDGVEDLTLQPPEEGTLKALGPSWGPGAVAVSWVGDGFNATLYYPQENTSEEVNLTIPSQARILRAAGVNHTVLVMARVGGALGLYWKDTVTGWSGREDLTSLLAEELREVLPIRHPEGLNVVTTMYDLRLSPTGEYALVTVWAQFSLNGTFIGNGTLYALATDHGLEVLDFVDYQGLAAGWTGNDTLAIPSLNKIYEVPGPQLQRDYPDTLPPITGTVILAVSQTPGGDLVVPYIPDPSNSKTYSVPAVVGEDYVRVYYGSVDNIGGSQGLIAGVWAGDSLIAARLYPSIELKAPLHTKPVSGPYMVKASGHGNYSVQCPQGHVRVWFGPSQAGERVECNTTLTPQPGYKYYITVATPQTYRDSFAAQTLNLTLTPSPSEIDSSLDFIAVAGEQQCIEYMAYTNYTIALLDGEPRPLTPIVDMYHDPGTQYILCYTFNEPGNHTILLLSLDPNGDPYYTKQYNITALPPQIQLQQPITQQPTPPQSSTTTTPPTQTTPPSQTTYPSTTSMTSPPTSGGTTTPTTNPTTTTQKQSNNTTPPYEEGGEGRQGKPWLPWALILVTIAVITLAIFVLKRERGR
ncbi:MAG: hypothetical protein F7C35_07570 [Desulfurococcales archaeon]|nr:hypothetical protein [Desulfurococcales archaeon]